MKKDNDVIRKDIEALSKMASISAQLNQATLYFQQKNFEDARSLLKKIISIQDDSVGAILLLGLIESERQHYDNAIKLIKKAINLCPTVPGYHNNLANIYVKTKQYKDALIHLSESIRLNSNIATTYNNRGYVLNKLGRPQEALHDYRHAISINPDLSDAHLNRAVALSALSDHQSALEACEAAIQLQPDSAKAYDCYGGILHKLQRLEESLEAYNHAIQLNPLHAHTYYNRALVLKESGFLDEALADYDHCLSLNTDLAFAHFNRGNLLKDLGRYDESLTAYNRAINLMPESTEAYKNLGITLADLGRLKEAESSFRQAIKFSPNSGEAYRNLISVYKVRSEDDLIPKMDSLLNSDRVSLDDQIHLGFALGDAYRELGNYKESFPYYKTANQLKRTTFDFSIDKARGGVEFLCSLYSKKYVSNYSNMGNQDDTPIFIIGMPRSGTSLIEQILSSHKDVTGAGELTYAGIIATDYKANPEQHNYEWLSRNPSDKLRSAGSKYLEQIQTYTDGQEKYITDKMPTNFWLVGFIRLMLPNARIIHIKRDARDTCTSIYTHYFSSHHPYAYDLSELGNYYQLYQSLMGHWNQVFPGFIYEIIYEDLVDNIENEVQHLLNYCNLPFDEQCLQFHKSKRPVPTLSFSQVRQPIYGSSIERWRRYEGFLDPLFTALEDQRSS